MYTRTTLFVLAVTALLLLFLVLLGWNVLQRGRSAHGEWRSLLARLASIDRDMVALVATDWMNRSECDGEEEGTSAIDTSELWQLIGGLKGLEAIARNCDVLIDLACYLQRSYPEAVVVAEELRLSSREVQWHLERLTAAAQSGRLRSSFPDYAQRAVATYYTMTKELLALYEGSDAPGTLQLQKAL